MPHIVNGAKQRKDVHHLRGKNLGYKYPNGLDLRPGSDLHDMIVDEVLARAYAAHTVISARFDSWNKIDQVLTAYIPTDAEEDKIKRKDSRKPVSIIFPYTYAIKETLQTYAMSSLVQDPIFQYAGVGPEDTIGAILLEKKIQLDCIKTKVPLALHTQIGDGISYGFGVTTPGWYERRGAVYAGREEGILSKIGRVFGRRATQELVKANEILFEGNKLENIDPYLTLPDPSVSIHKIQDGDFFGWIHPTSRIGILSDEAIDEKMFNCRYLEFINHGLRTTITNQSDRQRNTIGSRELNEEFKDSCDAIYMYIKLIPREWGLGTSEYPEKWFFGIAADSIVIRAEPLGLNHNMFPVSVMAPDYDGYQIAPLSRLETLYGLQHVINWLFNSHIKNVRKAINDMLVVDPWSINIKDLEDPDAGALIRTRRPMWGKGVRDSIIQLNVQDITQQNIADTAWIVTWMNHVAGVDESMMGSLRKGGPERLTGAEFQGTRQSAMSRLNRMSMVMSLMGIYDIAYFFAAHTQQFMSKSTYVKTAGRWEEVLRQQYNRPEVKVSPYDIHIDYDIVVRDGTAPGQQSAAAWLQLFQLMLENPETARDFDSVRIFQHIAWELGAKNVNDFLRKDAAVSTQVVDDESVMRDVEKGNLRAIKGV